MELVVLFDHRFYRLAGEAIYSPTSYGYTFFRKRYLNIFARVDDVAGARLRDSEPTEGPGVKVTDLGKWIGAYGYLKSRTAVVQAMNGSLDRGAAVLMIVPGGLASMAFMHLVRRNYPFSLEVVGDPWDTFSPGACRHPLRPILRHYLSQVLRRQCKLADAALYVTRRALQCRYPCSGLTAGISDVVLPPAA